MVTTRRSVETAAEGVSGASAVDLLERKTPATYAEFTGGNETDENLEEAKIRMQKNLDRLLNYEKYADESTILDEYTEYDSPSDVAETVAATDSAQTYETQTYETQSYETQSYQAQTVENSYENSYVNADNYGDAVTEEDITPTPTTMQFGKAEANPVLDDMERQKREQSESYKLNAKGKFIVALYAVAVALILTLIVLNTGILAVLSRNNAESVAKLSARVQEYNSVVAEIEEASSESHVVSVAENEYGMIKG